MTNVIFQGYSSNILLVENIAYQNHNHFRIPFDQIQIANLNQFQDMFQTFDRYYP